MYTWQSWGEAPWSPAKPSQKSEAPWSPGQCYVTLHNWDNVRFSEWDSEVIADIADVTRQWFCSLWSLSVAFTNMASPNNVLFICNLYILFNVASSVHLTFANIIRHSYIMNIIIFYDYIQQWYNKT